MGILTSTAAKCILGLVNGVLLILAGLTAGFSASVVYVGQQALGDIIPDGVVKVSWSTLMISAGAGVVVLMGYVVMCCCWNKAVAYTYLVLGAVVAVGLVASSGVGIKHMPEYQTHVNNSIYEAKDKYNFKNHTKNDTKYDTLYQIFTCCGAVGPEEFQRKDNRVPAGCCPDFALHPDSIQCTTSHPGVYKTGCADKLNKIFDYFLKAALYIGVVLAMGIVAMIVLTCVFVTCTTLLPL